MIAVHARSVFSAQSELISKSNPTSKKLESGINAGSVDIFGDFSVDPNSTLGIDWYKEIAHDMAQNKYIFFGTYLLCDIILDMQHHYSITVVWTVIFIFKMKNINKYYGYWTVIEP